MSGNYWHLRTAQELEFFNKHIGTMLLAGKKPRVKFVDQDRSTDQNSCAFALYRQISGQLDDQSINDVRAECKLIVGVGLLRASDEGFDRFYASGLKHLTYEQKIASMAYVPITSLMGKKVFSAFLDEVIKVYSQRGLSLIDPQQENSYE